MTLSNRVGRGSHLTPSPIPGSQAGTPGLETLVIDASISKLSPQSSPFYFSWKHLAFSGFPALANYGTRSTLVWEQSGTHHLDDSQLCICLPLDHEHLEANVSFPCPSSPKQITCPMASV